MTTTMIEIWTESLDSGDSEDMTDYEQGYWEAKQLCASDLESACTPRPPKPEWFGTGEGQWDSWWIDWGGDNPPDVYYGMQWETDPVDEDTYLTDAEGAIYCIDKMAAVLPVASEGFPLPVGWQVVGG